MIGGGAAFNHLNGIFTIRTHPEIRRTILKS